MTKRLRTGVLLAAFVVVLTIATALTWVRTLHVSTDAMESTILVGDHVLIVRPPKNANPVSSRGKQLVDTWKAVRRGDVVLLPPPDGRGAPTLLRCVAYNGETVRVRNGVLYVNGEQRSEPGVRTCAPDAAHRPPPRDFGPYTVPASHVFLLGDHRDAAYDSRDWGAVLPSAITGQAVLVYWSWDAERRQPRLDRIGRRLQ